MEGKYNIKRPRKMSYTQWYIWTNKILVMWHKLETKKVLMVVYVVKIWWFRSNGKELSLKNLKLAVKQVFRQINQDGIKAHGLLFLRTQYSKVLQINTCFCYIILKTMRGMRHSIFFTLRNWHTIKSIDIRMRFLRY